MRLSSRAIGVFASTMFLLAIVCTIPTVVPAHGTLVGTVCLVPEGTLSCSSSPLSLSGAVGTKLRVSVFIQASDGLNGFDITLIADSYVLKPVGVDLAGSVLTGTPIIVSECLRGALIQGTHCSVTDLVDTLHLAAISALGSANSPAPTTGLLFTAIYNVTGTGSIPLGYMSGCSGSENGTSTCVSIANGGTSLVPETIQTAIFTNPEAPGFSISALPTSLSIPLRSSAETAITLTSLDNFSGTVSLSFSQSEGDLSLFFPPRDATVNVSLAANGTGASTLFVFPAPSATLKTYFVTVTGSNGRLSRTVVLPVTVTTGPPDFSVFSSSGFFVFLTRHSSASENITISSVNGFSGNVNFSSTVPPLLRKGPTVLLGSTSATLTGGNSITLVVTIIASPNTILSMNAPPYYLVIVTGTSGPLSHSVSFATVVTK